MRRITSLFLLLMTSTVQPAQAAQSESFDYYADNRQLIQHGVQAVLMCNGLFTSNRTLQQVFDQELAYLSAPVGTVKGGAYKIDSSQKSVVVGEAAADNAVRAAFRPGIGCVVMPPDQTEGDIDALPVLSKVKTKPAYDPSTTPWPMGDLVETQLRSSKIDQTALLAASDWAFERPSKEQVTLSLLVVHKGQIIHERYADGVGVDTRTRTWSTAKSIAATLIGMQVDAGKLALDIPLNIDWLPELEGEASDPRDQITLRHVLNMSSGLYPVDSFGREYVTGSGLSYWAGTSSVDGARSRGLVRKPGTFWDYENYDTLLATYAMKQALGGGNAYLSYPKRALFDKIGMQNTLVSTDRFGDFIFSSQVYSNARDLARFGLLYLQNGLWNGERLLSKDWIEFVRTPAPATIERGNIYGGQFWLVPDHRKDVPAKAYATAGNRGQYVVIIPSHDTVIVRRGLDYGKQGFNRWDLTREVLKAIPKQPSDKN